MSETAILNMVDSSHIEKELDKHTDQLSEMDGTHENDDEDLEDGEIDDDDDDDNDKSNDVIIVSASIPKKNAFKHESSKHLEPNAVIDLVDDDLPSPKAQPVKSKKPKPVEDDHASSIENAIACALKKKGIEPPMPKLEPRHHEDNGHAHTESRSSRRRKRKKHRDEKEKDKDRKEKKKRYDLASSDPMAPPALEDDEMDDYEMLNVVGGSPPPVSHAPQSSVYKEQYNTDDDSGSSYDSYESGAEVNPSNEGSTRRRGRGKKESRKRRNRNRDDVRNGRQEKRQRHDSDDEKNREPRKLELCKFYLMECCAKRDKCSYMHSDFPCKFYYLGLECGLKNDCKFAHGEPLSEQLRNILLKHLETAPKEILGNNFKRMARDNAIEKITKRNEELCKKFSVENTWPPVNVITQQYNALCSSNRRDRGGGGGGDRGGGGGDRGGGGNDQHHQQHQQSQDQPKIPSLLDMVINPPPLDDNPGMMPRNEKHHRKSRWTDKSEAANAQRNAIEPPSRSAPSYLDLKNLTGIMSADQIEKLSQLGVVNLEQINQLTFGQLNQIGLTIMEISDIQLKAINMSKYGTPTAPKEATKDASNEEAKSSTKNVDKQPAPAEHIPSNRDVDMRFLPSTHSTVPPATPVADLDKDATMSSNSNSNSSSAVVTVDYSQYLKDSNISFDRGDAFDDEKDDEQLIIDDGNLDHEDNLPAANTSTAASSLSPKVPIENVSRSGQQDLRASANLFFQNLGNDENRKEEKHNQFTNFLDPRKSRAPHNPFKVYEEAARTPSGDEEQDAYVVSRHDKRKRTRSRSRSRTPTRSQSTTPEASESPEPIELYEAKYERPTMYDFNARQAEEDAANEAYKVKPDLDMRFLPGGADGKLRLPFQPVMHILPATEIEGAYIPTRPITWQVKEIDIPPPKYQELRKSCKSEQTTDPRLRRILGLPELIATTCAPLNRNVRKLSNTVASPDSEGASPRYYTPPSNVSQAAAPPEEKKPTLRMDPRRAGKIAAESATAKPSGTPNNVAISAPAAMRQNVEIRNLLQKSEWYKNLNSKFKIMVNQQLALVSTELKKFHQDDSPNKIFDISFILSNNTLQQILTQLGIYIDDNGEVAHVDGDNNEPRIQLPNLSQPPPPTQQQMDFLRGPPPSLQPQLAAMIPPQIFRPGVNVPPQMNMNPFSGIVGGGGRPSLLGLPPGAGANPFNPFSGNPNFLGGPAASGMMGGPGPMVFGGNFGPPNMPQQRNYNGGGGGNQRNQRNQQNRRNNKI